MKLIGLILLVFGLSSAELIWLTDFETAKSEATHMNKHILINFSGSDWCAPCRRMKLEIFDSPTFEAYVSDKLVLLNADFPRRKKNQLDQRQTMHNDALAERYNPNGIFPLTLLVDSTGNVLKTWEGFPPGDAEKFVVQIQQTLNALK